MKQVVGCSKALLAQFVPGFITVSITSGPGFIKLVINNKCHIYKKSALRQSNASISVV